MPVICAATGCNNKFVKGSEIRFYRFPLSKPQLASKWVQSLGMKNFIPTANTCLCSEHFRTDCFRDYNGKQFLREDAVPTIFTQGQDSSKIELRKRGVVPKETNVANQMGTQAERDRAKEGASLRREKRGGLRVTQKIRRTTEEDLDMELDSSESNSEDTEYDTEREEMFSTGSTEDALDLSNEESDSDWEPGTKEAKQPAPFPAEPSRQKRRRSSSSASSPASSDLDMELTSPETGSGDSEYDSETEEILANGCVVLDGSYEDSGSDGEPDTRPDEHPTPSPADPLTTPSGLVEAASSTPTAGQSASHAARGAWGRRGASGSPPVPHTADQQWHSLADPDVLPVPLVFMPVRPPGPQQGTRVAQSPLQFFQLFFSEAVLKTLLANTNAYGAKQHDGKTEAWHDITINDMFSFIAVVIYMGLLRCSALGDYWKRSRLFSLPFPSSVISGKKFFIIYRALHLSDIKADEENDAKKGTPGYDHLGSIKPLYTDIVKACKSHFQPDQHISINERTIASQTRLSFKQHVTWNKQGYKLLVLADSNCSYIWNFFVHEGKSSGSGKKLSYKSVMSLMDFKCLGTGYHLYVDKFYTSSQLFKNLLKKGIGACGIHAKRVGFPHKFPRCIPRGTLQWIRDEEVLFVKWMDKQEVVVCSTIHKAYNGDLVRRRVWTAGTWVQTGVPIPVAVKDYKQHMWKVFRSKAHTGYYNLIHKTKKWYQTFFFHILDIAVVNAHILYQQCYRDPTMNQKEFRQALVEELADLGSKSKSRAFKKKFPFPSYQTGSHKLHYFAEGLNVPRRAASTTGRRNCVLCQQKTPVGCGSCNVPLCFEVQRDCFNIWHTQNGL
ncbi:ARL14 effector protein isoform X1 [Etheostoma cragini]|uniref:ARL14 effector protein isoform X1 n=1 Tax=Etheostoma cragini TaxID=417921 RepID=UPI00155E044D|nr:ARL14 effector protein isoform X1 [Etheostoma cragini]